MHGFFLITHLYEKKPLGEVRPKAKEKKIPVKGWKGVCDCKCYSSSTFIAFVRYVFSRAMACFCNKAEGTLKQAVCGWMGCRYYLHSTVWVDWSVGSSVDLLASKDGEDGKKWKKLTKPVGDGAREEEVVVVVEG